MEPLPTFPFFADPLREEVFARTADACELCGKCRGYRYTCSQYGGTEFETLCPWCIADGSAGARGVSFNWIGGLASMEATADAARDRELVERRTPGFTTWQDYLWLVCCGRACRYVGEAESEDLRGRWQSAVPTLFEGQNLKPERAEEIVDAITKGESPCAYIFQCQVCARLLGFWDCD